MTNQSRAFTQTYLTLSKKKLQEQRHRRRLRQCIHFRKLVLQLRLTTDRIWSSPLVQAFYAQCIVQWLRVYNRLNVFGLLNIFGQLILGFIWHLVPWMNMIGAVRGLFHFHFIDLWLNSHLLSTKQHFDAWL